MGLIFIVIVVVLLFALLPHNRVYGGGHPAVTTATHTDTPLETLAKRYARGEIDRTEYLERRKDLL